MDAKASNVFKQSCASFLMESLAIAQINCEVTNQRLLSQRRLRAGRGLEGGSSLLIDVTVATSANATSSVSESSDANFDDQVIETFTTHSSQFTKQLQEDGIQASIDDFDILTSMSVYSIGGDVSEIVESPDGSDSPENGNMKSQYVAIAALSTGFLALIMLSFYRRFKQSRRSIEYESRDDESSDNVSSDDEPSELKSSSSNDGINDVSSL